MNSEAMIIGVCRYSLHVDHRLAELHARPIFPFANEADLFWNTLV
jgi:hypothetical protein